MSTTRPKNVVVVLGSVPDDAFALSFYKRGFSRPVIRRLDHCRVKFEEAAEAQAYALDHGFDREAVIDVLALETEWRSFCGTDNIHAFSHYHCDYWPRLKSVKLLGADGSVIDTV